MDTKRDEKLASINMQSDGEIFTSSRSALKNGSITLNNETKTDYMNQEQNLAVIRDITIEHSTDKGLAQSFS
jgi:hypothetical protein